MTDDLPPQYAERVDDAVARIRGHTDADVAKLVAGRSNEDLRAIGRAFALSDFQQGRLPTTGDLQNRIIRRAAGDEDL